MRAAVISIVADVLIASQRVPAIATAALLGLITLVMTATAFGPLGELVLGLVVSLARLAGALPFVALERYLVAGPDGTITFSTADGGNLMNDVVLPLFTYMTALLAAARWTFGSREAETPEFWDRYRPWAVYIGVCFGVFFISSLLRADLGAVRALMLGMAVICLITAAWACAAATAIANLAASLNRTLDRLEA